MADRPRTSDHDFGCRGWFAACAVALSLTLAGMGRAAGSSLPSGWQVYRQGNDLGAEARSCVGRSRSGEAWQVALVAGELKTGPRTARSATDVDSRVVASLPKGFDPGDVVAVEGFDDGWMVGLDRGEWGGNLNWIDSEGNRTVLLDTNVTSLVRNGTEVFVLSGLSHLSHSSGGIYLAARRGREWSIRRLVELDEAARAASLTLDGRLLAVTMKGILIQDGESFRRLMAVDYGRLAPNSVVGTRDGAIYVGLRMFVARLVPDGSGFIHEWLLPSTCPKGLEFREMVCSCRVK